MRESGRGGAYAATLSVLILAAGCVPVTSRVDVQDPAVQSRMAVTALAREDFAAARAPLLELAGRCRSGAYGRQAVLLLAAAELDTGNPEGSPQAALRLARSFLLLAEAPREEVVLARALYRLAADLGGTADASASDSTAAGLLVAPRFDDCESVPDLTFRPLPSTTAESLADKERTLASTLVARSDSIAELKSALATSARQVADLQSELERITQLLTSGAERRVDRP